ncbi:MAG: PAS domain S-box protein [Rhodothermales bacterium]
MNVTPYRDVLLGPLRRGEARADVVLFGALLTLVIFVVDLWLPLGIAGGVPYIAPVLLAMWLPDRRLIIAVAAVCSLLTGAGLWLSPPGAALSITLTNRLLAVAAMWTVAVLSFQRKAFEGALLRSEAKHRAVLATTADGVLTLDARGCITSVNPAAEQIFGYAEPELRGRPFAELLNPEHRVRFERDRAIFLRPAEQGATRTHEMGGRRESGACFPVEVVFVPVTHEEGLQYTVTVRDITERRLLEQHVLRASDEERWAVGYSLHEELGQSLTGLGMMSRQLARHLERRQLAEADEALELTAHLHQVDQQALSLFQSVAPLEAMGSLGNALDELAATAAQRHRVPISVHRDGLEAPVNRFEAAQLYQLAKDLLNATLKDQGLERVVVEAGRDDKECWLRFRLLWGEGSPAGWDECLPPLAYRANLIGVRVESADVGGSEESTVTYRWFAAAALSGAGPHLPA